VFWVHTARLIASDVRGIELEMLYKRRMMMRRVIRTSFLLWTGKCITSDKVMLESKTKNGIASRRRWGLPIGDWRYGPS